MHNTTYHTDEETLLNHLASGRHTAFEYIYKEFQPALVFFAGNLLKSDDIMLAEELVQDSFLKLYQRHDNFKTFNSLKAFLYICTRNACYNHLEQQKVRQRHMQDYVYEYIDTQQSIILEMMHTETVRELLQAINTLPPQCKAVVDLLIHEDKSYAEISEILGVTVSTVKNQRARAISLLKGKISGVGIALLLLSI
ncbi:RNA polymerase sigma factor [Sphingobacterium faecale]|uniref:Sigma-70 family RNA polymerase sigma factor n=1 Tax=Sphingobacterium faecale TaxID=2803775 RepID=A0ABS1R1R2_9SPHI|nr:sigma-70 family RNA polymerase sigma factor [Sphingobacterium faecale]MBL1408250.1 sigma-70 family RNA polymerase sigma factor [Sphingobacterium faecale]